jgi:hypothetical protein|tara:strand:- start:1148 stop:1411 length:264 start_codon:yes stop_codon:yes gene_type:complete
MIKTKFTQSEVWYLLEVLQEKIKWVDYNTLLNEIAIDLNKKFSTIKMTIENIKYITTNRGLEHYSIAQKNAIAEHIENYGPKLFTIL